MSYLAPVTTETTVTAAVAPLGVNAAGRLGVINGLRGIAILMVLYHHAFGDAWLLKPAEANSLGRILIPCGAGWLGVNIFFVLSGLVLFLPYTRGTRSLNSGADCRDFYMRRARRLLPLYYLNFLVAIILVLPPPRESAVRDWLVMLTATFNFLPATFMPPCNWVLWSLGIEIWFSILFPFLAILSSILGIARLLAGTCLLSLAVRYIATAILPADAGPLNWVASSLLGRLDDFAVGMTLAYLISRDIRPPRWIQLLGPWLGIAFLYSAAVLAAAAGGHVSIWWLPLVNTLTQLGTFLLLWAALFHETPVRRMIFANGPLQIIGMMCFSIYVWHGLVLIKTGAYGSMGLPLLKFVVSLSLLSLFSYVFIEFPAEKDWRKLFRIS